MIGIVGGGIGGLALGRELARGGAECVVLEAEPRAGGVIRSVVERGRVLDLGPQRTRLTRDVATLIREIGIDDRALLAPDDLPLWIYRDGALRRVPLTVGGLLRSDLLSVRGRLRVLREPFTEPLRDDDTVGGFLSRRFGDEAYRALLGPLFGGLYAGDPDSMPARFSIAATLAELGGGRSLLFTALRRLGRSAGATPPLSFRGGMQELPDALAREDPSRVRLGTRVRRIARRGERWVLLAERSATNVECDDVVLTVSADAAARLLDDVASDAAQRLRSLRYNPLALVHLETDGDVRGLGYQVAYGEELETRGVTYNASLFGRKGVCTAFLGGAMNPGIVDMPDDWVGETACNEFRTVTGFDASVLRVTRTRIPAWDASWQALDGLELPPGLHLMTNYTGRIGIGGRLAAAARLATRLNRGK